ncbi:MAG: type IV pilin protein [bacterium]
MLAIYGITRYRPKLYGFTLIELLVSLTIIGIIASAAIPAYSAYAISSRQASGMAQLSKIAIALEQYFTSYHSYEVNLDLINLPAEDKWFDYLISNQDRYSYVIQAIPKPSTNMELVFSFDQLGRQRHRVLGSTEWLNGWP